MLMTRKMALDSKAQSLSNLRSILSSLDLLRHQQLSATNSDCPIVWLLLLPLKIGHMIFKRPIHQLKSSMTKKLTKYLISLACTYCPFHQPKTPLEPDTRLLITAGFIPQNFGNLFTNSKFQIPQINTLQIFIGT